MTRDVPVDDRFRVSPAESTWLAAEFGTPLYVLDEDHLRGRMRRYRAAFEASYPHTELAFASKANSLLAVLAIAHQEGYAIDVASEGELRAALAAGVPAGSCVLHGNDKRRSELEFALIVGVGTIVVDHFGEIAMLSELSAHLGETKIILRLAPGVDPVTHAKISTGQADTKFGFNIADGSAARAVSACLDSGLPLEGYHCHVGSQLLDPEAQRAGGEQLARFARGIQEQFGFVARRIIVGGGLGVRYTSEDQPMEVEEYCKLVVGAITDALPSDGTLPILGQEPGRALVAESGVTLYEVGVVKTVPVPGLGQRTYVSVDGGLADNPRPTLYGSRYTVERVNQINDTAVQTVTVSGRHCETDTLFPDVALPVDIATGDLLQVLCTGAYNASMASNYNRFPRPATVLRRSDGQFTLIQRRDSWEELVVRESVPEDLA